MRGAKGAREVKGGGVIVRWLVLSREALNLVHMDGRILGLPFAESIFAFG